MILSNNKLEGFAQLIASGLSNSDAWRKIHPLSKASDKSINNAAYKLLKNADVRVRIAEIQAESRKALILTRSEAMEILTRIAQSDKGRTAIAAIERFAKMDGWDKPQQVDVNQTMKVIGLDDIRRKK